MWYYLCKICHKNGENAPCGGNEGKTDMKYASNNIRNILIAGHAGSGKTTLLNILAALDKPTGGTVLLGGKNLSEIPEFFRSILPYLPFRYSINAMREAVAGVYAQSYIEDLLYLLIYVAIALFIGIVLRKPCIRIMKFFNKRLEDTDLII